MRDTIKYASFSALLLLLCYSCGGLKNKSLDMSTDSVTLHTVNVIDTTSYMLGNNHKCSVTAEATITYPEGYKDEDTTEKLQKIFSSSVLDVPADSIKLSESFQRFVKNVLNEYGEDVDEV